MLSAHPTTESATDLVDLKARLAEIDGIKLRSVFYSKYKRFVQVGGVLFLSILVTGWFIDESSLSKSIYLARRIIELAGMCLLGYAGFAFANMATKRSAELNKIKSDLKTRIVTAVPGVESYSVSASFPAKLYSDCPLFSSKACKRQLRSQRYHRQLQGCKIQIAGTGDLFIEKVQVFR